MAALVHFKKFDKTLGIIGIPYSQSATLLLNCLISHEFAHYVYGERKIATKIAPQLKNALIKAFAAAHGITPSQGTLISNMMADWAQELFCDLFAVRLVGPCFSYAFIEIFDVVNDLDNSGGLFAKAAAEDAKFSVTHPAKLFRLKRQVSLLEDLGWWAEISGLSDNHYLRLLSLAKAFPDGDFKVHVQGKPFFDAEMLDALKGAIPLIEKSVSDAAGSICKGVHEYHDMRGPLEDYFKLGIVPSSIPADGEDHFVCPTPLTILNVAYKFYLENLQELINGIRDQDSLSVKHREYWARRVEMWAMKGIDDYLLLHKVRGA